MIGWNFSLVWKNLTLFFKALRPQMQSEIIRIELEWIEREKKGKTDMFKSTQINWSIWIMMLLWVCLLHRAQSEDASNDKIWKLIIHIAFDSLTYKIFKRVTCTSLLGIYGPAVERLERLVSCFANVILVDIDLKAGRDLHRTERVVISGTKRPYKHGDFRPNSEGKRGFIIHWSAVVVMPKDGQFVCVIVGDCPVYGL